MNGLSLSVKFVYHAPWLVHRERISAVLLSQLPVILFVELEIAQLPIGVAMHRRLDLNWRSVPHSVTPTSSFKIDTILLGELVLNECAVPIRSMRPTHRRTSRVLHISRAALPNRVNTAHSVARTAGTPAMGYG